MKILCLGHYRELGSGWPTAFENYCRALDSVGVEVVCRPVIIQGQRKPSEDVIKFEERNIAGCTHTFQHTIPTHWDWSPNTFNVGFFVTETDTIEYTHWENKIRIMDDVWVPNREMKDNLRYLRHTEIVPHATDTSKYDKEYPKPTIPNIGNRYVFYFIGENIRRKRINAILHAYNLAFDINDNVLLIIKSGRNGWTAEQCREDLLKANNNVKQALRLYQKKDLYPEVLMVTEHLAEEDLYGLHQLGDCFVNPTFGDAWGYACFDAMGFNKAIISPSIGGMKDYLEDYLGSDNIEGSYEPCFGADPFLPDLHTARENWYNISISHLVYLMQIHYEHKWMPISGRGIAEEFSYKNVGKRMLGLLNV